MSAIRAAGTIRGTHLLFHVCEISDFSSVAVLYSISLEIIMPRRRRTKRVNTRQTGHPYAAERAHLPPLQDRDGCKQLGRGWHSPTQARRDD